MKHYVDIHTHILPGIDDGARSMEESIAMLEMAYNEGVRTIYATPHYGMPQYEIDQMKCEMLVDALNNEIRLHGGLADMKVILGNEILYHSGVADEIKAGMAKTLGSTNFVLVEFHEDVNFTVLKACAREMLIAGYTPIYAHIERYSCLRDNVSKVESLRNEGVRIQVNAGELLRTLPEENNLINENPRKIKFLFKHKTGDWKIELNERAIYAWKLLEMGMVDFIASDAHGRDIREPIMEQGMIAIKKRLSEDIVINLVNNAQILVE